MAEESNKENFAGGLFQSQSNSSNNVLDPRKKHKTRSLSMGPGAAVQQLKEESGNRRKVCPKHPESTPSDQITVHDASCTINP